jgi:hypothetical protein
MDEAHGEYRARELGAVGFQTRRSGGMETRGVRARWVGLAAGMVTAILLLAPAASWAHGLAGKRFFPTTLAVEDPFVSDELSFVPSYGKENGEEGSIATTALGVDFSKRIVGNFGISLGEEYRSVKASGDGTERGFGNLELGAKYQFFTSEAHETILSVGLGAEIGGTGAAGVGAESFSVVSPALFFGKGFGDLPEGLRYLRPFALTGVIGANFPTPKSASVVDEATGQTVDETHPATFTWGLALQYSLQYLQTSVSDVGLGAPFNRMSLLVEIPMETGLDAGSEGKTTGMIVPGIVWAGKSVEVGLGAQIPVNADSGKGVGVVALVHLFMDDLFPKSLGRPLFP